MKLFKNVFLFTLATVLSKLVGLLGIPIYTTHLTPDDFGQFALVQAYTAIVSILITLQMQSSITRHYYDYQDEPAGLRRYLGTLLVSIFGVGTLMALGFELAGDRMMGLLYASPTSYRPYYAIGTWTVWATALYAVPNAVLRAQERVRAFLVISVASAALNLGLLYLLVARLEMGVTGAMLAGLLSELGTAALYLAATLPWLSLSWDPGMFRRAMRYSLPIIPHALLGYLFMYSDRLILERYVSVGAIGLYSLADRFSMVVKLGINSFNNAFSPFFMRTVKAKGEAALQPLAEVISLALFAFSALALATSLFAWEIVSWFAEAHYREAWLTIPVLTSAYIFRLLYIFASSGIFYKGKTVWVPVITLAASAANIGLNVWLIPAHGIMAAAWSTLASFVITAAMAYAISRRTFPLRWNHRRDLATLGAYTAAAVAGFKATALYGGSVQGLTLRALLLCAFLAVGLAQVRWRRVRELMQIF